VVVPQISLNWPHEFMQNLLFYNAAAGNQNLTSQNIFWSAGVRF
jgi:hypothetical protein